MHDDPAICYAAHRARDARFDGVFFTGVATTGIYCRPVCPARTPGPGSCRFFPTASAAEAAGFRPCLRCRPERAPGHTGESLAAALLQRIQERALEGVRMSDLDRELGLSQRHVRRLLHAEFGVTPVQIVRTRRLLLAKQLLQDSNRPVTEIALASGFRSLRAFHRSFRDRYRMAPGDCRTRAPRAGEGITLHLSYRPPLPWSALLGYFQSRLVPGVEEIVGNEYRRTVRLEDSHGWIRVRPAADDHALSVVASPSLAPRIGGVLVRVRRLFDLDARPDLIHETLSRDPLLAPMLRSHPGPRVGGAWDPFELAVRALLGQQISVAAATTLASRLARRAGESIGTPFPDLHLLTPPPEALLKMRVADLRALGLVRARAEALLGLAAFAKSGGLDFPPGTDHPCAVRRLTELDGIGPWTAHYIAMRALRYPDAFPAADLGLRKAIGGGTPVTAREAERRSVSWRPWRAYAATLLWNSLS